MSKELTGSFATYDTNDIENQAREDATFQRTGRAARTLVKTDDLNIALIVMRQGDHIQEHDARGAVSIYVKRGKIQLNFPDDTVNVGAGELLVMDRGTPHNVEALEDCSFILTIGLTN